MTASPPELKTFDDLDLPDVLREAILARGLTAPTQVQVEVASPAHAAKDLLVSSQTGSGKTLAFGILIGAEVLKDGSRLATRSEGPAALVVAPTRELAVQVQRELAWLFEATGARVLSATGGTDAREEMKKLRRGCEILVATPGRLIDHLERRNVSLAHVKVAVLDEADEMLDLGFREALETILKAAPKERRTHLFSATLPSPILKLASTYQRGAVRIAATGGPSKAHQDIEFLCHLFAPGDRENAVVNVLRFHDSPASIVFTKTRMGTAALATELGRRGFETSAISGDLTQTERTRALSSLREGRAKVLVATDVAARGLDLPEVGLVIHADLPMEASGLTHRSGRTGRAGKKGVSVVLCPRGEKRKAEQMMSRSAIAPKWTPLPTKEQIAIADEERLEREITEEAGEPLGVGEGERVDRLLEKVPVRDLVAVLLRRTLATQPAAAPLKTMRDEAHAPARPVSGYERDRYKDQRSGRFDRHDRERAPFERPERSSAPRSDRAERPARTTAPERDRTGERDTVHTPRTERPRAVPRGTQRAGSFVRFRVNVGENRQAEPRWVLPLICRRGNVTGDQVGSIRISERSTTFEIAADVAAEFEKAVTRIDPKDPQVRFAKELSREELSARYPEGERPPRAGAPERPSRSAPPDRAPRASAPERERPEPASRPATRAPTRTIPGAVRSSPASSRPAPHAAPRVRPIPDGEPSSDARKPGVKPAGKPVARDTGFKPGVPSRRNPKAPEGYEE